MTRQIKFRAFDIIHKKWMNLKDCADINNDGCLYPWARTDKGEVVLMQFTGLLDKNGKEIYEGDILSYPSTESEYVDVGVGEVKVAEQNVNYFYPIELFDGMFGMNITYQHDEVMDSGFHSIHELKDCVDSIEIIGNIYENPELLK